MSAIITISQSLNQAVKIYQSLGSEANIQKLVDIAEKGDKEITKRFNEVRIEIGKLANVARENALICKNEKEQKEQIYYSLLKEKETLYTSVESGKAVLNDLEAKILRLQAEVQGAENNRIKHEEELRKLRNEIERIEYNRKQKAKKIRECCWVPFYGLALYIDYEVDEKNYKNKINSRIAQINQLLEFITKSCDEINRLRKEQTEKNESSTDISRKIGFANQKISELIDEIDRTTANWYDWERLCTLYEKAEATIKSSFTAVKIILCFELIVELKKEMDEANNMSGAVTKFISGCTNRGQILFDGQKLNKGEYISSFNRRFVAVLDKNGKFAVYNSKEQIWCAPTTGDMIEVTSDGIKLNDWKKGAGAGCLIMQDDGNLVAYRDLPANTSLWASDTWQYRTVESGIFAIPLVKPVIAGVRANTGAFIDGATFFYNDGTVTQLGATSATPSQIIELKPKERIISVAYADVEFSGEKFANEIVFETSLKNTIRFSGYHGEKKNHIKQNAPSGKYIHSFKSVLAWTFLSTLEIDETKNL